MARQGDADFLGWVSTSRDGLRTTAFLLCGDWHLADDLVQDALTRVFGVWGRVSGSGDPGPYARNVLVNLYLDHRRRPSRRETPTADLPDRALEQPLTVDGGEVPVRVVPGPVPQAVAGS